MKILLIDDMRNPTEAIQIAKERCRKFPNVENAGIVIARTYKKGFDILSGNEKFDILLLDHDLGDDWDKNNGAKLIRIVEKKAFLKDFQFNLIVCISANPVGRNDIERAVANIERWKED